MRVADAAAATGRHVFPDFLAAHMFVYICIFRAYFAPVAFELLSDQLRKSGEGSLTELGACDANDDGVIRLNHDPVRDFGRIARSSHRGIALYAQGESAGERGGLLQEGTA